ncbi:GNAT family N-acetyltransferase [Rhizobium terrae]|uniref:GNAT family N-acetyltransferase n=1 Tax=Rhizobium terrae TaxID=2171756 RepID=UPI000E3D170E|nr:GNAT family N-acetyltransferase [Rhizobium terrae]
MTVPRLPIRTERLVLRPTTAADAARAFEIQSDWEVTRMLRMAAFPPDAEATRGWFADHQREWSAGEAYRFAVEHDGRMIGLADLDEIADGKGDLGYWYEKAAWGHGLAFEAAQAVVRFAFGEASLSTLKSGHAADNAASGRILTKLGFTPVDTVEVFSKSRGGMIRQHRYALTASR